MNGRFVCTFAAMSAVKKILLIRFSSIGDIVLTSPVIRSVRNHLPEVEMHVLTKSKYAELFAHNPYINKVHPLGTSLAEVINDLKRERFDFVADLHCNIRSMRVRAALRTPSAGFPKLNLKKYLLVRFKYDTMPKLHVVDRYFEAVRPLGVTNDGLGLDFFTGNIGLPDHAPAWLSQGFVAVVIGGQHNTKIMPADKVARVIELLGLPVVLLGGSSDAKRAATIVELASQSTVWNASGKLSLMESAKVLKAASAVLTNDTGLMHIAAAYHKPIVSVWGNTVPALGMWPYMPEYESLSVIIENKALSCRPCSKIGFDRCPKGHFKCMNTLNEEMIARELLRLVEQVIV